MTVTFSAVADSEVRILEPDSNFGTLQTVKVDPATTTTTRGLFRFDVSQIPAGSTIASASLRLCQATGNQPGTGRTHQLRRLMSPWTEQGVTWNNQPPVSAAVSAGFEVIDVAQCTQTNVRSDVQIWVDGANNYGWRLGDRDETILTGAVQYASREHLSISHRPQLVVTYFPPGELTYYLHENPYPPQGDSTSSPTLPMSSIEPTGGTLYNYDTDLDALPGIVVKRGGADSAESDGSKYQSWVGPSAITPYTVDGGVSMTLWSAAKDFRNDKAGAITVYLRDCSGTTCTTIGSVHHSEPIWQGGSATWRAFDLEIATGMYTVAANHWLELKVIVPDDSEEDLMFAYDTTTYDAHIHIPIAGS